MKDMIGQTVTVTVDRPLGSAHPNYKDTYYPINYGYIDGTVAADGEAQDAYILGVDFPVQLFVGKVIAVIHRIDDVEDKLVVAADNSKFSKEEIEQAVNFQEKYFKHTIITWLITRRVQ